jgi:hypothetical protein
LLCSRTSEVGKDFWAVQKKTLILDGTDVFHKDSNILSLFSTRRPRVALEIIPTAHFCVKRHHVSRCDTEQTFSIKIPCPKIRLPPCSLRYAKNGCRIPGRNHDLINSSFHEAEVSSIKYDTICGTFSIRDTQGFIIAS